jgi:nucleolar protein 53
MAPTNLKAVEAPQQFKQPSRKGKKAWRKNVDVTEVQEGLRVVREEEIKGQVSAINDHSLVQN